MSKQTNPFNNFLFSVPGNQGKMTYNEMKTKKNIQKLFIKVLAKLKVFQLFDVAKFVDASMGLNASCIACTPLA
jgi:hypothetical protein